MDYITRNDWWDDEIAALIDFAIAKDDAHRLQRTTPMRKGNEMAEKAETRQVTQAETNELFQDFTRSLMAMIAGGLSQLEPQPQVERTIAAGLALGKHRIRTDVQGFFDWPADYV